MILMDMDEVLVDFTKGVEQHFDVVLPDRKLQALHSEVGMTEREFWGSIHRNETFWFDLEKTPFCDELINWANDTGVEWQVCSKPVQSEWCAWGKQKWVNHYVGKELILIQDKSLLSNGSRLLIDDYKVNTDAFGLECSVLFPNIHRNGRRLKENVITFLEREISYLPLAQLWRNNER